MKKFFSAPLAHIAFALLLALAPSSALAQSPETQTKLGWLHLTQSLQVDGNAVITGTLTQTGQQTFTLSPIAPGYVLNGATTAANTDTIAITAGQGQATVYTIPDPVAATDTFATLGVANVFTALNVFPAAGIVLKDSGTHQITLKEPSSLAASETLNIPAITASDTIVTTGLAQTIASVKTYSSIPVFPTGGISFNTANVATVLATNPAGGVQTYTIPDPGASASFMMTAGAQSITGANTFAKGDVLATIGTGTATYSPGGRLFSLSAIQTSSASVPVNTTYTLPANTLTTTGQGIRVKIHGITAANGNTKACTFKWGATPVTITLPLSTGSAKDFYADILIYRTGASTQELSVSGFANALNLSSLSTTGAETETGTLAMELNIPTSTGGGDVVVDEFTITAEQ